MDIQVSVHDWLVLPMSVRIKLREFFNIPKSTGTLVEGNIVKSDGTTYQDLQAITVPKMQEYLGESYVNITDFVLLFNAVVEKIQATDIELEPTEKVVDPGQVLMEEWAANLNRMKAQAEGLNLAEQFKTLITNFFPYGADEAVKQKRTKGRRKSAA